MKDSMIRLGDEYHVCVLEIFFCLKQKTASEKGVLLVGSEMYIGDRHLEVRHITTSPVVTILETEPSESQHFLRVPL